MNNFGSAWCLKIEEGNVVQVDVVEVEDVLCLFAFGSFPLIDNIYMVCLCRLCCGSVPGWQAM